MARAVDCGEVIWGQGRSPDPALIRSLGKHLETAGASCVTKLPPEWRKALLQAECSGRSVVSTSIKAKLVLSVLDDLQDALRGGGAEGGAVTPDLMLCMAEHAVAGDASCALEFGRLLCIYAATRPPGTLRSSTVLTEVAAKVCESLGTSRLEWYGALFRGCDQSMPSSALVLEFILNDALAGASREDALAFCEAAVLWIDLGEAGAIGALMVVGSALEPFMSRDDFNRERILSENTAKRYMYLCAISSEMRFPESKTPIFSACVNADDLQDFMKSDAATLSSVGRSWRSTLAANAWSFLGHDEFLRFLHGTAPDGFDRDVHWHVRLATGTIRSLLVQQAQFERLSEHAVPRIREFAATRLRELAVLQDELRAALARTSDPTLREIQGTCRAMPIHGQSMETKLRHLVGTHRAFEVLRDPRAPSPGD